MVFLIAAFFVLSGGASVHALTISVNASSAVTAINNELYGQNYAVYDGTAQSSDANYAAYTAGVSAMGCYQMRYPGGGYTDMMNWNNIQCQYTYMPTIASSVAWAKACGARLQPCVNFSGQWCGSTATHAAAVTLAAQWVTYMNVTGGGAQPTTFWEVGNEEFVTGEPGYVGDTTAGGTTYGTQFCDFYTAMKAADPNIKVGAQVQYDHAAFTNGVLAAIKAKGITMDYCISHCYPYYCASSGACETTTVDSTLVGSSVDLGLNAATSIKSMLSSNGFPTTVPLWMSEFRSTVDEEKAVEWVDSMFVAQFLLKMGENGWRGANIWDIKNGYNTTYQSDYGLLASETNTYGGVSWTENKPHPSWYVYPFLSKVFGRNLVSCSSSAATVRSWASTDTGGNLTVFMVNNDFSNQQAVTISLTGFSPGTAGTIWTLVGSGQTKGGATTPVQDLTSIAINGVVNPAVSAVPGTGNALTTGASFAVTLPAGAMVMVKVPSSSSTPIPTYTRTGTPTVTATPGGVCISLLNGCNSITENGTWSGANASRGIVTTCPVTTGLPSEGTGCLAVTVTTGAAYNNVMFNLAGFTPTTFSNVVQLKADIYIPAAMVTGQGWASLVLIGDSSANTIWSQNLSGDTPSVTAGLHTYTWNLTYPGTLTSVMPISTIYFAYNAQNATTGTIYVDNIRLVYPCGIPTSTPTPVICAASFNNCESLTENGTWSGANATRSIVTSASGAPAGFPTMGSACLKALFTTWNNYSNGFLNLSGFKPTDWYGTTRLSMDIYVDPTLIGTTSNSVSQNVYNQFMLMGGSSAATVNYDGLSSTVKTVVSGLNSVTFTIDFTDPGSGASSLTSNTPIDNLYFIFNSSTTVGTGSIYVDNIQLLRDGCIATRTPTRTFTPAPTSTMTRTFTATPTPTASSTPTATATATRTSTATSTPTSASTSTSTPTPSLTPTRTNSPTATVTATPTSTRTSSPTNSPTNSPTLTSSATPTATPTSTATRTNTSTFTATNTVVSTNTMTSTSTASRTYTPTATLTPTVTSTATSTATASPIRTGTSTWTGTPTVTGVSTSTLTLTATSTASRTSTSTATSTPTSTLTNTATSTASPTRTGTSTWTGTPTATGMFTSTVTLTPTATATRTSTSTTTSTLTVTSIPTSTTTASPTRTGTSTWTGTPTSTGVSTGTMTATPTSTSSRTSTPTATWSLTSTPSSSPTSSSTSTFTPTSSWSATSTSSATRTSTPTVTNTSTNTSSPTVTSTITWTVTGTQPPTNTSTVTSSPTSTATVTPTPSSTPTSTSTHSATATATASATSTRTWTATPVDTATPTSSSTPTSIASATPTWTSTATKTSTATATVSSTPTATNTGTQTFTQTSTLTGTPTASSTKTSTPTSTASSTPTVTASATPTASPSSTLSSTWSVTSTPTPSTTSTPSATTTWTATDSATWTPTWTSTASLTWTATSTTTASVTSTYTETPMGDCANVSVSASYPNPVSKGVVKWSLRSECPKPVLWSVFTSAYRKVGEWNARVDGITVLLWDLKDGKGRPMAPGVYYAVFVIDGGGRQVRPLVILP